MNHGRCLIGLTRMARRNMTCYRPTTSRTRLSTSARFQAPTHSMAQSRRSVNSQTRRPSALR